MSKGQNRNKAESYLKKIRDNELKKIPYLVIVGEKEAESQTISVRERGGIDKGSMSLSDFKDFIREETEKQLNAL